MREFEKAKRLRVETEREYVKWGQELGSVCWSDKVQTECDAL